MKHIPTVFLKGVITIVAIGVLYALIRFPQTEGRAANLDLIGIYSDPLIIYAYLASIPFFVALFQGFKVLGYVDNKKLYSPASAHAMKLIKNCAALLSILIVAGLIYIRLTVVSDDPAGITGLSVVATAGSIVVAFVAAHFERILKRN